MTSVATLPNVAEQLDIHVHGGLTFFVDSRQVVAVPVDGPRSVKDAIEAAGIPHPEVDLLLVDGKSVGFDAVLWGGERVDVHPPDSVTSDVAIGLPVSYVRPPAPPDRFACDVHLGRLARRLRLLGFDTWYRTEADDGEIAALVVDQDRILLTRDRGLLMRRTITYGYCPRSDDPNEQILEVVRRFDLGESIRPLSLCGRCNGRLAQVAKSQVLDRLPPHTRREQHQFSQCTDCGQVYWPGSHLQHIEAFVDRTRAAVGRTP